MNKNKIFLIFTIALLSLVHISGYGECKPGHEGTCNDVGYISMDYLKTKTTATQTNTSTLTTKSDNKTEVNTSVSSSVSRQKSCTIKLVPKDANTVHYESERSMLVDQSNGINFEIPQIVSDIIIVDFHKRKYPQLHEAYFATFGYNHSSFEDIVKSQKYLSSFVFWFLKNVLGYPELFIKGGLRSKKILEFKVKKVLKGELKEGQIIESTCSTFISSVRRTNCLTIYNNLSNKLVYAWPESDYIDKYKILPVYKEIPCSEYKGEINGRETSE
ncbi:MAG: hypothetical protein M9962_13865 [Oligoflexia bacterium]|nr:hypothetical protein [Oligoflexia bacterium]